MPIRLSSVAFGGGFQSQVDAFERLLNRFICFEALSFGIGSMNETCQADGVSDGGAIAVIQQAKRFMQTLRV